MKWIIPYFPLHHALCFSDVFVFSSKHKSGHAMLCVSQGLCMVGVFVVFGWQTAESLYFPPLPFSLQGNMTSLIFEAKKQYFIESRRQHVDEENMLWDLNNEILKVYDAI